MKRPFADQTNQYVPRSTYDRPQQSDDRTLILLRSTHSQLSSFIDFVMQIEKPTYEQKLKINHTVDHLILLLTDLPVFHSYLQPPSKKMKREPEKSKDFEIKQKIIPRILNHLFNVRKLMVLEQGESTEMNKLLEVNESLKQKIKNLKSIDVQKFDIHDQTDENSRNLLNLPGGLYTTTSQLNSSLFGDLKPFENESQFNIESFIHEETLINQSDHLLNDSPSKQEDNDKKMKTLCQHNESDDSISTHYLPKCSNGQENDLMDKETRSNKVSVLSDKEQSNDDEKTDANDFLDDGVKRWPSDEHSNSDIVKYLRVNYQEDDNPKSLIDKIEMYASYTRFFGNVRKRIYKDVFLKLVVNTFKVKRGIHNHKPVYRYIVRKQFANV